MPGFDRTGPMGEGPMTGGGFGYCRGVRCGRGRRMRSAYAPVWAQPTYEMTNEEVKMLQEEAKELESELKAVRERIGQRKD